VAVIEAAGVVGSGATEMRNEVGVTGCKLQDPLVMSRDGPQLKHSMAPRSVRKLSGTIVSDPSRGLCRSQAQLSATLVRGLESVGLLGIGDHNNFSTLELKGV
jgi:hypothetical protein